MTDRDSSDSLIGRRFYDYRITKKLAEGGMGAVYLLFHESLPSIRKVLKVILSEFAQDPLIRDRFRREAEAVSQLVHPNIVGIDSVSTLDDGQLCMLIPFLEGKPLDEFVRDRGRRLDPHRVMHIASHISRALDYAHRRGIVHRDLKPANVFIEPTDDDPYFAKVLDFGIAKQTNPSANHPSVTLAGPLGTPYYMAVEQYEHPAEATPAADIYALAIMIWEMVTGRLPWGGQDVRVLYHKQLLDPPDPPAGDALSAEWEAILRSALAADPRERPQSMRQFLQALASALPAVPPHLPSGAEILRGAPTTLIDESAPSDESAPNDETVRTQSYRPLVSAWPQGPHLPQDLPPASVASMPQAEPVMEHLGATANQRRRMVPLVPSLDARMIAPSASGTEVPVMPVYPTPTVTFTKAGVSGRGGSIPGARWAAACAALIVGCFLLRPEHADPRPSPARGMARVAAATIRPGVFKASLRPQVCSTLGEAEDCAEMAHPERVPPIRVEAFELDVLEVSNYDLAAWLNANGHLWKAGPYGIITTRQEPAIPLLLASEDCFGALTVTAGGRIVVSPDKAQWPAVCVTWHGANEYCRAQHKRLPLAVESELAAKGAEGRPFPWGNDMPTQDGVAFNLRDGVEPHPRDVGRSLKDVSPEGVHDLGGNVAEWVEDGRGVIDTGTKTIRGGSWGSRDGCHLLGSGCKRIAVDKYSKDVGFRCASSAIDGR